MKQRIIALTVLLVASSCGDGVPSMQGLGVCDRYPSNTGSPYVLPYVAGQSFSLGQGNCGSASHYGRDRYSYDFTMPIGTTIVAARAGTVINRVDGIADGRGCPSANVVQVQHSDGTVANYVHLTPGQISVAVGAAVTQGQTLAKSGNSGCSTGPHLHFSVYSNASGADTVPVTFSNTSAHPNGLRAGKTYTAQ